MDSPSLPEATPNPSLPEHMKPRSINGKGIVGRGRVPIQHRLVIPFCFVVVFEN